MCSLFCADSDNDNLPPPGFVGARGRRDGTSGVDGECHCENVSRGKRVNEDVDMKHINTILPNLWSRIQDSNGNQALIMALRQPSGKKDNIVYKDGFLGVRG